jgi:DNA adenine methylase
LTVSRLKKDVVEGAPARPFLKWVGGKTQLLAELRARIPAAWRADRDRYVEPFVGAGALFFHLRPAHAILCDANSDLVDCWTALRDAPGELVRQLRSLQGRYLLSPQETYLEVRGWYPESLDPATRAARLIMLNKAGFNGLYRVNKQGKFNVPWGQNPRVKICDADNLENCSAVLRDCHVDVRCCDFEKSPIPPPGSLVYLDPPYAPLTRTANFTSFTKAKFTPTDQSRLVLHAEKLAQAGCHVIVSQSSDETTVELYRQKGFQCDRVSAVRMINSSGHGRGAVGEYIIHTTVKTARGTENVAF